MATEYQHGAPTEFTHPGKPSGSGGSKNRFGTDTPLSEEALKALNKTFAKTEGILNMFWAGFGWSFGLSIFGIGAYYLFVYVFRAHLDGWCLPGEESSFPLLGIVTKGMKQVGIKNTPETWILLCMMLVLTACMVYIVAIMTIAIFLVYLTRCIKPVINFGGAIIDVIQNPFGSIAEWKECNKIIFGIITK